MCDCVPHMAFFTKSVRNDFLAPKPARVLCVKDKSCHKNMYSSPLNRNIWSYGGCSIYTMDLDIIIHKNDQLFSIYSVSKCETDRELE